MKKYKLINNITGWVIFAIAAFTYLMTIEPTASLWDCGEFIATGYKLEVGHPPGNPVFILMANFFSHLAGKNLSHVAAMVNSMSALASAFTILFLFWTITHLARKIIMRNEEEMTTARIIAVMAAGVVGALAYTFSDSFWFSAVEGEVYASSSFFTAIVFWAILKWEDVADEKYADRWIILIAYLIGLSIGVHLLNLLTIPAMGLVYYFRKFEFSWKGFVISLGVSVVLLALLMWGIIPGIVAISTKFDLFFVNTLDLPANSGMIFHVIILATLLILAVRFSRHPEDNTRNGLFAIAALFFTGIWVVADSAVINILVLVIIIGAYLDLYSKEPCCTEYNAYSNNGYSDRIFIQLHMIVIRSSAGTPLNENNPSNPFNLLYFINRDNMVKDLFSGGSIIMPRFLIIRTGKPIYALEKEKYIITHHNLERVYDRKVSYSFPEDVERSESDHIEAYKEWGGNNGIPMQVTDQNGKKKIIKRPRFSENLKFMFSYQFGYMYFRYFMWNFAGKQNDTQGNGRCN